VIEQARAAHQHLGDDASAWVELIANAPATD
jgi:hypothetical protein